MSQTRWVRGGVLRDGEYEEWMVSATYGVPPKPGETPHYVAGAFYGAKEGVVDEASARECAKRASNEFISSPRVTIWHRYVPAWEEV